MLNEDSEVDEIVKLFIRTGYVKFATSILKQEDFRCVCNVPGSWQAWTKAGLPIEGGNGG